MSKTKTKAAKGAKKAKSARTAAIDAGTDGKPTGAPEQQSAAAPVAVPADRGLRVPVQLPYRCVGGAGRVDRLVVCAAV